MPNNVVIFNKVTGNFKKGPEPRRVGKYLRSFIKSKFFLTFNY